MEFVFSICIIQPLKDFQFTKSSFVHNLIVPNDLHSDICVIPGLVSGANDVGEHTLPGVTIHCVSVVQILTNANSIISFSIIPIIGQRWIFQCIFIFRLSGSWCINIVEVVLISKHIPFPTLN
ncbi:unnamed protein product [Chrysodeixis includens]|uniref:Uncharacterized protein n=1 Tax=Chrysodeixis includens TaxID=689277 RepID=A0A9N8KT38_CHRIL|nr:unnamed protein product [Chrysodeixis includens]